MGSGASSLMFLTRQMNLNFSFKSGSCSSNCTFYIDSLPLVKYPSHCSSTTSIIQAYHAALYLARIQVPTKTPSSSSGTPAVHYSFRNLKVIVRHDILRVRGKGTDTHATKADAQRLIIIRFATQLLLSSPMCWRQ